MSFAFMRLYTGDYRRDTLHLTPEEHGIYLLLLMYSWDQKGPIPLDERRQCGIVNARSGGEIESLRRVITEYFTKMEDGYYNSRMQEEIVNADFYSAKSIEGGKKSGEARRQRAKLRELNHPSTALEPPLNGPSRVPEGASVSSSSSPSSSLTPSSENQNLSSETVVSDRWPACPVQKIQTLYHEILPMCPRVRVSNSARDGSIRGRWKQLFADGHVESEAEALDAFREYFARVAKSKFLTGQGNASNGRKPFLADLTWLMNATNFAKVIERGYA